MEARRVVITGAGVFTPIGYTLDDMLENLANGRSGISWLPEGWRSSQPWHEEVNVVAMVDREKARSAVGAISQKLVRRIDYFTMYALAAALSAVENAGLGHTVQSLGEDDAQNMDKKAPHPEAGIVLGVGIGGQTTNEEQHSTLLNAGPRRIHPFAIPRIMPNSASGAIAITFGLGGPNYAVGSACASSIDAMIAAYKCVRDGDAQIMLTGGAEAVITPLVAAGFAQMGALTNYKGADPTKASRPFDKNRNGFVLAEGAVVFVLEDYASALARKARILSEIVGYGQSDDAVHITQPSVDGPFRAMRTALQRANIPPSMLGYISAHGTSTPINDENETAAIKRLFSSYGEEARAYSVPVSSAKSMTGHLIGAAGAVGTVACLLALTKGVIPPTINLEMPDPKCDLDYVPKTSREAQVDHALVNAFGFGGHNAVLVLRRCQQ